MANNKDYLDGIETELGRKFRISPQDGKILLTI